MNDDFDGFDDDDELRPLPCTCLPQTTYFPAEPDDQCPIHGEREDET